MKIRIFIISLGMAILLAGCGPSISLEEKQHKAEAQYKLGIAGLYAGKYPDALIAFEKARELTPDDPKIYNALGLIYFRQEKYQQAAEAFQRTLQEVTIREKSNRPLVWVRSQGNAGTTSAYPS